MSDLNIHLDVVDDRDTRRLAELLRHIRPQPVGVCADSQRRSYSGRHITRADLALPIVDVRPSDEYSDHSLVLFQLPLPRPLLRYVDVNTRMWKGFDADRFKLDLLNSRLCMLISELDDMSADCLQQIYDDDTLSTLLDKHVPRRVVRRRHQPTTPWFDSDCAVPSVVQGPLSVDIAVLVQLLTAVRGLARCDVNSSRK